jgi:predicted dehydrogenase
MIIEAIGRRLRLAVIGGGPGSVSGEVHRAAARLDGYYDIVASALSSDPERSRRYGHAIGISDERAYPDIGTHSYHLGAYVTGLDLESLCADVGHVVPGRKVDDYVSMLLRYSNGARGSMWVTNAASGAERGLSFRIFGETGGLEWYQEEPNRLVHRKRDGLEEIITRRQDSLVSEEARRVTRVQIGHPEGYIESFANLYSDFARAVVARMRGEPSHAIDRPFPTVEDGVKGLAFVQAAMQSSAMRAWKSVEVPST